MTGNIKAIKKLVSTGADVNAKKRSLEGMTPLHLAAAYGQIDAIQELVKLGARVNAKDNHGGTPLMEAVSESRRQEVVCTLLDLEAGINLQDRFGQTALDLAAFNGDFQMVRFLLERGANPNQRSGEKCSASLAMAAEGGNLEVLKLLLAAKASLSAPDYGGSLPLGSAALKRNCEFVRLLLESGADPNERDRQGYTPLMCAARRKAYRILSLLIDAGADVNIENEDGETALDIAEDVGSKEIIGMLTAAGAKRGSKASESR